MIGSNERISMSYKTPETVLVAGAGGFIGGSLVRQLIESGASEVRADMGGIRELGVQRFFFASSACVYAADKQDSADVVSRGVHQSA